MKSFLLQILRAKTFLVTLVFAFGVLSSFFAPLNSLWGGSIVLIMFCAGLLIGSFFNLLERKYYTNVQARVIEIDKAWSKGFALITFQALPDGTMNFYQRVNSDEIGFKENEVVDIFYDPEDAENFSIKRGHPYGILNKFSTVIFAITLGLIVLFRILKHRFNWHQ